MCEYAKIKQVPVYVLALDIEKAYDSVDRATLDIVLEKIGVTNNRFY